MGKKYLMQGNQAVAEGAIAAGVKVCAGYPITPSSETIEVLAKRMPSNGGRFIQMEDELASIGVIIGASAAGKKAITATSGPGFSLMQELLGYAAMVELPIVIYNAQRVGPSTGGATKPQQGDIMQSKWGSHGDSPRIVIYPSTVQECFDMTIDAFNLAEKYMNPVVLMGDEILAHLRESVEVPDKNDIKIVNRRADVKPQDEFLPYDIDETGIPVLPPLGEGYRYNISGMIHAENGIPNLTPDVIEACIKRVNAKLDSYYDDIVRVEQIKNENAKIAVLAYGAVTRPAKGAVKKAKEHGIDVELFRPITIWPFPEREIREVAERVDKIIVVEMNLGQVSFMVRSYIEGKAEVVQMNKVCSRPITVDEIFSVIKENV
jgi:2-oxoglutarate ferredoxin oxidoreductase subunit alpha